MSADGAGGEELATVEHPFIYEINTWVWLDELRPRDGHGDRPRRRARERVGPRSRALGFDAVWLMGVWERSPAGIAIALAERRARSRASGARCPTSRPEDVVGSPYCVRDYTVDAHLGGPEGLAAARAALAERGLGADPRLRAEPRRARPPVDGGRTPSTSSAAATRTSSATRPRSSRVGDRVLANGRDPYFPAWPDVVQLNAFSPDLRAAVARHARARSPTQCDGVRCDMAMLMMNDVFERTWGERAGPRPDDDYWPDRDPGRAGAPIPDFVFMAEAYWDLEWALQQQGFDYCYDKRLYDRLVHDGAEAVRGHLSGRPRLPGAARPLRREPRRAARGGDVPARARRARPPWRR